MKRWLRRLLRAGMGLLAASGFAVATVFLISPEEPGEWVSRTYYRITGKSVEIRTRQKSRRCAINIASDYAAARAASYPAEDFSRTFTPAGLMDKILEDAGSARDFAIHRPGSAPAADVTESEVRFYIDVFANAVANDALLKGMREFPAGSVILKRKSAAPEGKGTEYYTGMRKNWEGYWPEHGDWEFFVLDAVGKEVEAGKLQTCADCHEKWADRGFVSRSYIDSHSPGGFKSLIDEKAGE